MRARRRAKPLVWVAASMTLLSLPAAASQVVVLAPEHMSIAAGNVVAQAVATELSRHPGFTAISYFELKALLSHEANRQALGCAKTACMRGVAEAMGAELLLACTKDKLRVQLSLLSVADGKVVARAVASVENDEVVGLRSAVATLVEAPLPEDTRGPAWLSRRGFRAVVLGFLQAAMEGAPHLSDTRKRIVSDLIHTELDVDVAPKIAILRQSVAARRAELRRRMVGANSRSELQRLQQARGWFEELHTDAARAEEVRARARQKGTRPSMGLMRFPAPEPAEQALPAAMSLYLKTSIKGRKVVEAATKALSSADLSRFQKSWHKARRPAAIACFSSTYRAAAKLAMRCEPLPDQLLQPAHLKEAGAEQVDKHQLVFVRCRQGSEWLPLQRVSLTPGGGQWRIDAWEIDAKD